MARIYIGRATGIGSFERHVVLKLITPERANDHTAVQMFLDEARLAASLNHQNVAQVFEVGEDGGIHYLAMEYVHGQDSRAVLAKAGSQGTRIPLELALTIVAGAAAGLHHAHERRGPDGQPLGIVHRDVSPSNIMIGYDGAVKLLDFGIAKATARSVETQSGIIKGKFAYMAPEQCRGRDVDRRSDVFSLGIILYEISTQHRCFRADSDFDTMHRIVTGDVVRPSRLIPGYPPALEAIVMKALAVDPAQRYQTAGALLEAIESFAISSRMAMSTMALGRFMRDMFGDVPEPWLTNTGRASQPSIPKESTISSTNGKSGPVRAPASDTLPPGDGIPDDDGRFPDSASVAARTVLDLPRGQTHSEDEPQDEWNAKSYPAPPALVPAPAIAPDLPLTYPVVSRTPTPQRMAMPHALPQGTQPLPPQGHFTPNPGSGSGSAPAHPAMPGQPPIVSTRHGYASAVPSRGDISYPRYDAPADALAAGTLKPNRRPLIIGLGIAVIGIIVVLAVSMGGGSKDSEPAAAAAGSDTAAQPEQKMQTQPVEQPKPPAPVADENMVSIHIVSDPKGADVLIAGTKIGVTPLDTKLKRGTKITQLTVRLAGYQDVSTKIDLGGDYSNEHIKLVKLGEEPEGTGSGSATAQAAPPTPATTPSDEPKPPATKKEPAVVKKDPPVVKKDPPVVKKEPTVKKEPVQHDKPAQPKCQPPGPNVDPFSPIPICAK
jgi:serine/threonine protein kinase